MHDTQAMTTQQQRITGGHLAHWSRGVTEGPFIINQVLTGGAYRLRDASTSRLEPNPWNAARLRRFYA